MMPRLDECLCASSEHGAVLSESWSVREGRVSCVK